MKKKVIAVLLLLVLLLSSCTIPLKETNTAEDKTKPAPGTETGTRESVTGSTADESEPAATEPEPAAEDPERIAVIRSIRISHVAVSSTSGASEERTQTVTEEIYLSAEGLPARIVSAHVVSQTSESSENPAPITDNEIFLFYHFDENGRLDRVRRGSESAWISLEWAEENGTLVRLFFLQDGEKKTELSSGDVTWAANLLSLLQYYTAFADAELIFEGTTSRMRLQDGKVVYQRIQQNENTWTETESEEAGEGISRTRSVTHTRTYEYVQIMEYDREKRMIRLASEESGRSAAISIRYESLTEDGKRTDLGYMDELETDDEEIKADMAEYEGVVILRYFFDEQGRLSSYTMYEDGQPFQSFYFDEAGRIIRQENLSSVSSGYTFITETEYRKASEIEETLRLEKD
jgi:hypothetical protein